MQIRPTSKLTETSRDTRNTLAKFEDKVLQNKDTVNLLGVVGTCPISAGGTLHSVLPALIPVLFVWQCLHFEQ